jgi:hypothetical protein
VLTALNYSAAVAESWKAATRAFDAAADQPRQRHPPQHHHLPGTTTMTDRRMSSQHLGADVSIGNYRGAGSPSLPQLYEHDGDLDGAAQPHHHAASPSPYPGLRRRTRTYAHLMGHASAAVQPSATHPGPPVLPRAQLRVSRGDDLPPRRSMAASAASSHQPPQGLQ